MIWRTTIYSGFSLFLGQITQFKCSTEVLPAPPPFDVKYFGIFSPPACGIFAMKKNARGLISSARRFEHLPIFYLQSPGLSNSIFTAVLSILSHEVR